MSVKTIQVTEEQIIAVCDWCGDGEPEKPISAYSGHHFHIKCAYEMYQIAKNSAPDNTKSKED